MNYMINKTVAIQGNRLTNLNPMTDTSIFLATKSRKKNIKFFIMSPKIYQ